MDLNRRGLQRRDTRFGLSSLRRTTPDSDDESSDTTSLLDNDSSKKLRKRSLASRDSSRNSSRESSLDYIPLKMPRLSQEGEEAKTTSLKELYLPQAVQHEVRAVSNVRVKHLSPWDSFRKLFCLVLEDSVTIAIRKDITSQRDALLVAVKQFSGPDADQKVDMLQRIRNKNFLVFLECFSFEESCYVVLEHEINTEEKLPVTLRQFALISPYPSEWQLAVILGQILDGLEYLASIGLEHGALTCKNVLIGTKGSIRITGQECCRELTPGRSSIRDLRGIGYVTMELMNKEAKDGGPVKVYDTIRWPLDSKAVRFLLATESAYSISELKKHPLCSCKIQKLDREVIIKPNVYISEFSIHRGYGKLQDQYCIRPEHSMI